MTREQIETLITDNITTNSNGEITAVKVKTILDAIVNDYRHSTDEITLSQVTDLVSSLAGKQATLTATNIKTIVDSLVEMTTPIDADKIIVTDSAGTTVKKLSWTNIKAFLKTYFDTLYQNIFVSVVTYTASSTLALTDAGKFVIMNVGSANDLTVPPNADVSFSIGTQINVVQNGAGKTRIKPGVGVTLNSDGAKTYINSQYSGCTLIKIDTNTWSLIGNLATS
jgi:hypothetical protein